jgi:hypothetical protein
MIVYKEFVSGVNILFNFLIIILICRAFRRKRKSLWKIAFLRGPVLGRHTLHLRGMLPEEGLKTANELLYRKSSILS